ncbi:hypothetical protein KDK_73800 [Dictyobacter kobayashii]|uniref:Uncharacterized protein n=1 Tax=Dictyobacter kobayashii TaxID=2014872 RepID=A0A402AWQ1_9CHLR|nr:hypothetical protein KDK_73800 [Dictyobacter kobayashii]
MLDAARVEAGTSGALLHLISDGNNPGTVEVALSRDDHYVFATDETGQTLSIIDFQQVQTRGSLLMPPLDGFLSTWPQSAWRSHQIITFSM